MTAAPHDSSETLTIEWLGHAAFLLSSGDTSLLLDPSPPMMGYQLPQFEQLTAVLITHRHQDHTYVEAVAAATPKLFGLDEQGHFQAIRQQVGQATVYDVAAYHDNVGGWERGEDALWVIELAGLRVLHMGDFGQHQLTAAQLSALGQPDVLLMPVGGTFTVDGEQAKAIVAQLQPRLTIPMHYHTEVTPSQLPLVGPEAFLAGETPTDPPHRLTVSKAELANAAARLQLMSYK